MSRLAKKPIQLPQGLTAKSENNRVILAGAKGTKEVKLLSEVKVEVGEGKLKLSPQSQSKRAAMNTGTMWSLIQNALTGLAEGFTKTLEIEGVGYRAQLEGKLLSLALGYVNPVRFPIPEGITITVEKNVIKITGTDKELVGLTAAKIRALKKPEPYKGKGIRYQGEVIRRKVGKKAVTAGS